jgi:hypothetical protein
LFSQEIQEKTTLRVKLFDRNFAPRAWQLHKSTVIVMAKSKVCEAGRMLVLVTSFVEPESSRGRSTVPWPVLYGCNVVCWHFLFAAVDISTLGVLSA